MKFRPFISVLATLVLLLLLTASAGAYWIATNSPAVLVKSALAQKTPHPDAAMFVSSQSPVVATLLINPDRLETAQLLVTPANQRQQNRLSPLQLNQLKTSLLPDSQLNYRRDIQPWLGDEVVLAITTPDLDRDDSNGVQMGYLAALTTQDLPLVQRTLDAFWQRYAKNPVVESYGGIQITYSATSKRRQAPEEQPLLTLASAIVGDRFILLANSPKVLRDAINNVQVAELSLANSEPYQQVLEALPTGTIGFTAINLPQFSAWITGKPEPVGGVRTYDSLLTTWELQANAWGTLLLPAAGKPQPPSNPRLSAPVGALQFIPAASLFTAAGTDLSQLQVQPTWAGYETLLTEIQRPLADLQQEWNLSLPEDVLSWITGEYALGLLPRSDRDRPDWVFVTRRSPETIEGLKRLDAIAQAHSVTLGSFTLDTPLGSQEISAWTQFSTQSSTRRPSSSSVSGPVSLKTEVQGVRTVLGDYEIFATSLEAMNLALQPAENSLQSAPDFQQAISALKSRNDGYVHLRPEAIRHLLRQIPLPAKVLAEKSSWDNLLSQLQSLTFSGYGRSNAGATGAIAVQLEANEAN